MSAQNYLTIQLRLSAQKWSNSRQPQITKKNKVKIVKFFDTV